MKTAPQLKKLMTPFPYSIDLDASVKQAQDLMEQHNVHHLPVTEGHTLIGVVTDRDVKAKLAERSGYRSGLVVRDVYVSDVYVVAIDEPLDNVLMAMAERHIGSVLVTKKGRLAGVFTSTDACRGFGDYLRELFPRGTGDEVA
ncbi:MAG: CBS domain-containing protein [Gammaproteobacteria bacterium]|nr:CBS domain-containing protein [Gammaproteobacteria bacterium]